jgi:hypothetical protein
MRLKFNMIFIGVVVIALGTFSVLWISELCGLWINGISHVSENVEGYYNNAHPVEGEYSV